MKIKEVRFVDPMQYMGKSILIQLKGDAKPFLFKCTGYSLRSVVDVDYNLLLNGQDTEGLNLSIDLDDIDYVIGG